jgi:hypothetical protein
VQQLAKELYGGAEGSHATPSEVAVTQFAFLDAIKSAPLDPPVAPWGAFTDAADYRRKFPGGRIGSNPVLATPKSRPPSLRCRGDRTDEQLPRLGRRLNPGCHALADRPDRTGHRRKPVIKAYEVAESWFPG